MTDQASFASRTCATCACFLIQENPANPLERQGFCRRNTALHARGKMQVPRLDTEKKIVNDRNGKPILETIERDFYIYPPTMPELTCFDGWRSLETLPGDPRMPDVRKLIESMRHVLKELGFVISAPELVSPLDS